MKTQILFLSSFAAVAWSGPARWGCEEQCSTVSNDDCAVTYVACRTGCEDAVAALPTLAAPICAPNATASNVDAVPTNPPVEGTPSDVPTPTSDPAAMITPPPEDPPMKPGYCRAAWVCEENFVMCGSKTVPYGGCFDVCKGNSATPPPCTLAPDPEAEPVRGGLNMKQLEQMKKNAADRLAAGGDPCNETDTSRCKPEGW